MQCSAVAIPNTFKKLRIRISKPLIKLKINLVRVIKIHAQMLMKTLCSDKEPNL
jgi:hypothetical protein